MDWQKKEMQSFARNENKASDSVVVPSGIAENQDKLLNMYKNVRGVSDHGDKLIPSTMIKDQATDHLFGAAYYKKPESEKQWQAQMAMANKLNIPLNFNVALPPEFVKWEETKRQAELYVKFDAWIEDKFLSSTASLADKEFIKTTYPAYFEARTAHVEARQALDKRLFELKLKGPSTQEDLMLEFLLINGYIVPDTTPIWASGSKQIAHEVLTRGFANIHNLFDINESALDPAKPEDIAKTYFTNSVWGSTGLRSATKDTLAPWSTSTAANKAAGPIPKAVDFNWL